MKGSRAWTMTAAAVSALFFALVRNGTPVNIATRQPEDATLGQNLARPQDYNDPEHPPAVQLSDKVFNLYQGPLFEG